MEKAHNPSDSDRVRNFTNDCVIPFIAEYFSLNNFLKSFIPVMMGFFNAGLPTLSCS
jgi:hypothetical protein